MSTATLAAPVPIEAARMDPLAVPLRLPARRYGRRQRLQSLSVTSVRCFELCPETFRRRYLLGERDPVGLSRVMGSVFGDAIAHYYQGQIKGQPLAEADVDDLVCELFATKIGEARLGPEEDPDLAKAQCRSGAASYLTELAPAIEPLSVERRASFRFCAEQEWRFVCYFDLECDSEVPDLKFGRSSVREDRAARDLQATAYTYMRWAEGRPAIFTFHSGLVEAPEEGPRWKVVPAPRTVAQLQGFERRVALVARQIAYLDATELGEWPMAADLGWWCAPPQGAEGCSHWHRCPVGAGGR